MKLEYVYLDNCYHNAMVSQYERQLREEGFNVEVERNFGPFQVDLYAEKKEEKRIYEFKYFQSTQGNKNTIGQLKELAESQNAKLYMVYMTRPREKEITFDDLDIKLTVYLNDNMPTELDALSSHTKVEEVIVDSLNNIIINDNIKIQGDATISVVLQFGSNSDDGYKANDSFPMTFEVELDKKFEIQDCKVTIDIDPHYSDK